MKEMQRYKYPKTMHLPWSPGLQNDDRLIPDISCLYNKNIVITEKLDGENTTIYSDGYIHARSIDGRDHPSRSWIKGQAHRIISELPDGWRVTGENLYAKHSIYYNNLESYFYIICIIDDNDIVRGYEETRTFGKLTGFPVVPHICDYDIEDDISYLKIYDASDRDSYCSTQSIMPEGFVFRNSNFFPLGKWNENVAKYVRKNHIQTDKNWMTQPVVPNKLKEVS